MPEGLPLDFDVLLAPISEDNPGGDNLYLSLRDRFDFLRKEVAPDEGVPPEDVKDSDWPALERETREALTTKCKDFRIAGNLLEALIKRYGFEGLRQGLQLFNGLFDKCWDFMYPMLDPEEMDMTDRSDPLENLLNVADRGLRIPTAARLVPIVHGSEQNYSFIDWQRTQRGTPEEQAVFDQAVSATNPEAANELVAAIDGSLEDLKTFCATLTQRMEGDAPALTHLEAGILDSQRLAKYVAQKVTPDSPDPEEESDTEGDGTGGEGASGEGGGGSRHSRAGIYKQLGALANSLQKLEPHSPVPYLIRRAVDLGAMPFPELLKTLIRDMSLLGELNRELGIPDEEGE